MHRRWEVRDAERVVNMMLLCCIGNAYSQNVANSENEHDSPGTRRRLLDTAIIDMKLNILAPPMLREAVSKGHEFDSWGQHVRDVTVSSTSWEVRA